MPPTVASIIFAIGILGLFYLDRDEDSRMSKALWIPAVWLFLVSSRGVSLWLGMAPRLDSPDVYQEGSPLDRAVFGVLLILALAVVISRMERVGPLLRKNGLILLFFAFCAVSILWSDFPLVGFNLFPLSVLLGKYYPDLGRRLTNSWTAEITGVALQKNSLGVICMLYGIGFLYYFGTVYRDRGKPDRRRLLLAYGTILVMIAWLLAECNSTTSISGLAMAGGV